MRGGGVNEQARIRAAIAKHPSDKCVFCGSTFQVEGLLNVREDIPLQRCATAIGTQICRSFPPHPCEAGWSNFKPERTGDAEHRYAPVAPTGAKHRTNRSRRSGSEAGGDDDDGRIWHLLDRAIQDTARREFIGLCEGLRRKEDVARQVEAALKSLELLKTRGVPDYGNPWVAVFYLTWYQPRHINLVYSHLKSTNARLPQALHVVDLGCGSLATMFALAVFAATSGQQEARISVHGIDNSREMRTLGLQLWQSFSKMIRVEARGSSRNSVILERMDQVIERMSGDTRPPSESLDDWLCSDSHCQTRNPTWLTSVHSAYHLPQDLRRAIFELAPAAMLITADHSRSPDLDGALPNLKEGKHFQRANVALQRNGCLVRTTKWRQRLRERIIRKWGTFELDYYLKHQVQWNPWQPDKPPIVRQAGTFQ